MVSTSLIFTTKQNRMLKEKIQLIKRKIISYHWWRILVLFTIRIIESSELSCRTLSNSIQATSYDSSLTFMDSASGSASNKKRTS
jgi:hypothetical protein